MTITRKPYIRLQPYYRDGQIVDWTFVVYSGFQSLPATDINQGEYRGLVFVDGSATEGKLKIGDVFTLGGFRLRVIDWDIVAHQYQCMIERPAARLYAWRARVALKWLYTSGDVLQWLHRRKIITLLDMVDVTDSHIMGAATWRYIKVLGRRMPWYPRRTEAR